AEEFDRQGRGDVEEDREVVPFDDGAEGGDEHRPAAAPLPLSVLSRGGGGRTVPLELGHGHSLPAALTDAATPSLRPVPSAAAEPEQRVRVPVAEHRLRVQACPQGAEVVEARVEFAQLGGREVVDLPPMGSASVAAEDRFEDAEVLVEVLLDE